MKSCLIGAAFLSLCFSSIKVNATDSLNKMYADSIVKPQVRNSPIVIANLKTAENNYVKCTYGQPLKKGRVIFGELVPFGKLWRTGANEATEITFTTNIKIGETSLSAGTYTLFSIPDKDNWTIILNSELGQWGDFTYSSAKDVLTYKASVSRNSDIYEGFTVQFEDKKGGFDMNLLWDDTKITVPIQVIGEIEASSKKKKKKKR
jgi:Protein of unknown function (DUF2911)